MHIRHTSYMNLLLDQAYCTELATHCAFCHLQNHPKAMSRHYRDQHQEKFGPVNTPTSFVQRLANFGSGRGQCPLCRTQTMNTQTHHCCAVFQLATMIGHVFQPANFAVMPCMKRAWHPSMASGTDHVPDEVLFLEPVTKKPRGTFDLTEPEADTPGADPHTPPHENPRTSLHKCSQCPANFLTPSGIVSISINTLGDHYSRLLTSLEESGSDLVALSGIKILCT